MNRKNYLNRIYKNGLLSVASVIIGACATTQELNEKIHFIQSRQAASYPGQNNPAILSVQTRSELKNSGYVELGTLEVTYTLEICEESQPKNCQNFAHQDQPTARLLREAAIRGGDIVVLDKDNLAISTKGERAGQCTKMAPRTVDTTVEECAVWESEYDYNITPPGWTSYCAQYIKKTVQSTIEDCVAWEKAQTTTTQIKSTGTIWHHDPNPADK